MGRAMVLRNLIYLRLVLFLALLLAILYAQEPRIATGVVLFFLILYGLAHATMRWLQFWRAVPIEWELHTTVLDLLATGMVVYAISGTDITLYVTYFVVIVGSLVMESLAMGFLVAGVSCTLYGLTIAAVPNAFSTPATLLPFALLAVTAFYVTFVSSLIRGRRRAVSEERQRRALWTERLAASRSMLGDIKDSLDAPLSRLASASKTLPDEQKASEILWEIDAIRGQLFRMANILQVDRAQKAPLEIQQPLERAIYRLQAQISESGFDVELGSIPNALVRASKDHMAELFYGLLKDLMGRLPAGARITISGTVRPPQWWERSEAVKGWLSLELAGGANGAGPAPDPAPPAAAEKSGSEAAEWILGSFGGRIDERPQPGGQPPRFRVTFPVVGFEAKAAGA